MEESDFKRRRGTKGHVMIDHRKNTDLQDTDARMTLPGIMVLEFIKQKKIC